MTDTPQKNADIADYRLAVERHLADLPASIREDLLNGLEEHLAEVAADLEPGVPLSHLLGSPEAYARELRETAEFPRASLADRLRRGVWGMADPSLAWAKRTADKFTGSAGVGEAAEFGRTLRPAWWVLRGLVAAALVTHLFVFGGEAPRRAVLSAGILGFLFVVAIALAFVWLSLRLGIRSRDWGRRGRRLTAAGGIALVAAGVLSFAWIADGFVFRLGPQMGALEAGNETEYVSDVYVYDENGELLTGVYLFDQHGNPLYLGEPWSCDQETANNPFEREGATPDPFAAPPLDEERYGYRYPLCLDAEEPAADASGPPYELDDEHDATESAPEEPTTEAPSEPTSTSPELSETPTG
ncbi:MAG TPA: hypothetical protein VKZ65_11915 [Glycomyces sp.]|nr:hypothetical protein [Glycomyces sp.]